MRDMIDQLLSAIYDGFSWSHAVAKWITIRSRYTQHSRYTVYRYPRSRYTQRSRYGHTNDIFGTKTNSSITRLTQCTLWIEFVLC
jgi:hypothetical protein